MRHLSTLTTAAVAAVLLIWACSEPSGPSTTAIDPAFNHKPGHGGGPPGGGGDGEFPTVVTFRDDVSDNIRSDAELRSDPQYSGPAYEDGVCGVAADLGNFDDARLDPDGSYKRKLERDCGAARALIFEWDDPDDGGAPKPTRVDGIFSNIDHVLTVAANATELRTGQYNLCGRLIFNPVDPLVPNNGSDLLLVTFNQRDAADPADDEWVVETQAYPNDKGYCEGDGRLWHMPFRMTMRRK